MSKKLIFLLGKTSSGKDTVAKYLEEKYGYKPVCSYTTRPKRNYEVDGVQHYFVNKEMMSKLVERDDVIAYTKFPKTEVEYCAILGSVDSDKAVYIITPDGVSWFKEHCKDMDLEFVSVYVDLPEDMIINRALERGDSEIKISERLDSEREQFDNYKKNKEYDYLVDNSCSLEQTILQVDNIMRSIFK